MKNIHRILSIETSCDETAAAVVEFQANLDTITPLSSVIASQIPLHKQYGGVYPEMASRAHSQKILPVVSEALAIAKIRSTKHEVRKMSLRATSEERGNLTVSGHPELVEGSGPRLLRPTGARNDKISAKIRNSVTAIAVTAGPGLAGSLIVGVEFARGLSAATGIPLVAVNHLEGHIYANFVGANSKLQDTSSKQIPNSKNQKSKQFPNSNNQNSEQVCDLVFGACDLPLKPVFPLLALVVSGGHTMLVLMRKHLDYKIIGSTLDDAAGECFDKVARMLGLPYPGGPALEKLAREGNPKAYDFPRSMLHSKDFNFSFSGLKTAVFYKLRSLGLVDSHANPISPPAREYKLANGNSNSVSPPARGGARGGGSNYPRPSASTSATIRDIAASFQQAVIDVLVAKTLRAAQELGVKSIIVGGGVIANSVLRDALQDPHKLPLAKGESKRGFKIYLSPRELATDNALSIGIAGAYHFIKGNTIPWQKLDANASLRL